MWLKDGGGKSSMNVLKREKRGEGMDSRVGVGKKWGGGGGVEERRH